MSEKKYFCFCSSNCKYETMTKEQILAAITQAANGSAVIDPDAGVMTKVKETNAGGYVTFWVGTQAQYNALQGNVEKNCLYIITDETTKDDINNTIASMQASIQANTDAVGAVSAQVINLQDRNKITKKTTDIIDGSSLVTQSFPNAQIISVQFQSFYDNNPRWVQIMGGIKVSGTFEKGDKAVIQLPAGEAFAGAQYDQTGFPCFQKTPLACCTDVKEPCAFTAYLRDGKYLEFVAADTSSTSGEFVINVQGWYRSSGEVIE